MKTIHDPIYGCMCFSDLLVKAIDTPEMQRLRKIKQLGTCFYVYPSATHTRFEHSLGVAHLSRLMMEKLQKKQPELNITERMIELVELSGLFHDIGHGPFSHVFDNYVIPMLKDKWEFKQEHEERSQELVKEIGKRIDLKDSEIETVCALIHPTKEDINKYKWLTQIIADPIASVDVDKFDYIARDAYHLGLPYIFNPSRIMYSAKVIDDVLCYPEKNLYELETLFNLRYRLHQQVYSHSVGTGIELLITDVLCQIAKIKPEWFQNWYLLTDNIIEFCYIEPKLRDCVAILDDITNRRLMTCEESKKRIKKSKNMFIIKVKKGYKKNPLKNVWVYDHKNPDKRYLTNKNIKNEYDVINRSYNY